MTKALIFYFWGNPFSISAETFKILVTTFKKIKTKMTFLDHTKTFPISRWVFRPRSLLSRSRFWRFAPLNFSRALFYLFVEPFNFCSPHFLTKNLTQNQNHFLLSKIKKIKKYNHSTYTPSSQPPHSHSHFILYNPSKIYTL